MTGKTKTKAKTKTTVVLESENTLRASMKARIRELGQASLFMSGSFVRTERKCGSKTCECANGGKKHPCCLLTSKVAGKTKAIYIPVEMESEIEGWAAEHKRVKALLKEIDRLGGEIIRCHVAARKATALKANMPERDGQ